MDVKWKGMKVENNIDFEQGENKKRLPDDGSLFLQNFLKRQLFFPR